MPRMSTTRPAVDHRGAGHAVPAAVHRERQSLLAREVHRRDHVIGGAAHCDHRRLAVDHAVEDGPRRVVSAVVRGEELAPEPRNAQTGRARRHAVSPLRSCGHRPAPSSRPAPGSQRGATEITVRSVADDPNGLRLRTLVEWPTIPTRVPSPKRPARPSADGCSWACSASARPGVLLGRPDPGLARARGRPAHRQGRHRPGVAAPDRPVPHLHRHRRPAVAEPRRLPVEGRRPRRPAVHADLRRARRDAADQADPRLPVRHRVAGARRRVEGRAPRRPARPRRRAAERPRRCASTPSTARTPRASRSSRPVATT